MNAPPAVPTAPVAGRRPPPRRALVVAAVIVAVTVLRPWGDPTPPAPAPPPRVADAAEVAEPAIPAPTEVPAPTLLPDQIACNPSGWQVVSLDRLGPWTVRSWVPAEAVLASGPLDPRVQRFTLESPEVLAIGACAPSIVVSDGQTIDGGPARFVRAWRIDSGRAVPIALDVRRAEVTPTVATLYRPTDAVATPAAPAHWPGGVYVLQVAPDDRVDRAAGRMGAAAWIDPDEGPLQGWFVSLVVRPSG